MIEERVTTKSDIVKEINRIIKRDMKMSRTLKGIEIDVKPEWYDLLLKDGSIIRSYEKAGWKVRWWEQHEDGPATGRLLRSWLLYPRCTICTRYDKTKEGKIMIIEYSRVRPGAKPPERANPSDAGLDLYLTQNQKEFQSMPDD